MRKVGLWRGSAVLLLALGTAAASAAAPPADVDDDGVVKPGGPDPASRPRDGWNPFLSRVFGSDDKKPAPKPDKDKEKDKDAKADTPAARPTNSAEIAARYRALEEAKWHRRQDVCERLKQIAHETHDEELERKAIQLDALAFEVYQERVLRFATTGVAEQSEASPRGRTPDTASDGTGSVREVKP